MTSNRKFPNRWTKQEDSILHEQVVKHYGTGEVNDWNRIADQLPGRTNKDCRKRWINQVCGGLRKGTWGGDEDARLRDAMSVHGQKWTLIASAVGSRSADQCAKRWQHSLDPKIERGNWTTEEDEKLLIYTILTRKLDSPIASSSHSQKEAASSPNSQASSPVEASNDTDEEDSNLSDTDMENTSESLDVETNIETPSSSLPSWNMGLGFQSQPIDTVLDQSSTNMALDDSPLLEFWGMPDQSGQFQSTSIGLEVQPASNDSVNGVKEQDWTKLTGEGRTPNFKHTTNADLQSQLTALEEIGGARSVPSIDMFSESNTQGGSKFELDTLFSIPGAPFTPVTSVVIRADKCDWETLRYLMVVTKPVKDQVTIEIKHSE
ncbi:hypothetical protein F4680DRAFT_469976 [Xylaria scruposa]|nr:hypothetical protein F4680DRAFT_469976 [Xylaria scruposa]